jgi:hypothetical protein
LQTWFTHFKPIPFTHDLPSQFSRNVAALGAKTRIGKLETEIVEIVARNMILITTSHSGTITTPGCAACGFVLIGTFDGTLGSVSIFTERNVKFRVSLELAFSVSFIF